MFIMSRGFWEPESQEQLSWVVLVERLSSGCCHDASLGCGLIWRLIRGWGFTSSMAHFCGCWPQFLFMELYEKPLDMATGSLQSDWRESKAFFDLVSEATHHHFCHILFIGSESLSTRGRWVNLHFLSRGVSKNLECVFGNHHKV